jgi:hypothetical protein
MTGEARTSAREGRERPGGPTEGHWAGWPMGRRGGEGRWATARPKGRMGRLAAGPIGLKVKENSFPNKDLIFEYTKALEICRRRFRRDFDMRIFLKSSRLSKYFRKMKYVMPCYATLSKIN